MKVQYESRGRSYALDVQQDSDLVRIEVEGETTSAHIVRVDPPQLLLDSEGKLLDARTVNDGDNRWIHVNGQTFVLKRRDGNRTGTTSHTTTDGTGAGLIIAPMPGQVRGVLAQLGDSVQEGQPLILLEAMKMEIRVTAPQSGQLKQLDVQVGQSVEREQVLGEVVGGEYDSRQVL